jgi:hypothetical protein
MSETAGDLAVRAAEMVIEFGLDSTCWTADSVRDVASYAKTFTVRWEPASKAWIDLDVNGRSGALEVRVESKLGKAKVASAAAFSAFLQRVVALQDRIEHLSSEQGV